MGLVRAPQRERAYHFDANSPIAQGKEKWCHLIDVNWGWNPDFRRFEYKRPRAAQHTVLLLNQEEIDEFEREAERVAFRQHGFAEDEIEKTLLLEKTYLRYTPAALREIGREHAALSNRFAAWLENAHHVQTSRERDQIDTTFETGDRRFLAEFKIAYLGKTKRAIREALGQTLEYNHYPPRVSHDQWLLILDTKPSEEDKVFLRCLREAFGLPLTRGWETNSAFVFENPEFLKWVPQATPPSPTKP